MEKEVYLKQKRFYAHKFTSKVELTDKKRQSFDPLKQRKQYNYKFQSEVRLGSP